MAGFAPGLAPIALRPPTPPKENTAKASPSNGFGTTARGHVLLDTPDESPSSSAEYFKDSAGKAQKKVGFTLLGTQYHRFSVGGQESDSDGQIRQLPRSRDCKSSKSILKTCTDNAGDPSSNELLAFDNTNLPAMLRSTTQHLASASRSSRLDAYSTLLACLSAYDEVPEAQELAEKVAEITGYTRRDVTAKNEVDGSLDMQLVTQALKLITIFLCAPSTSAMFPEDFCSFILDRSILSLEDEASPKILVSHYMHLLEKQKFASKFMTMDRVNRLLSALDAVTARVKGNRVVGHRLMIYQRLLSQAKPLMVSRVGSWIDHLISGMLSTIKDIRTRAIVFGMDASLQLGTTSSVSLACVEVFNRASADGTKVVDFLSSRLIEMANSKEDGIHVPQVWSVVILFLRSRRRQLEGWEHLKAWLAVIQRCFNSTDGQTKSQANIAWNRLIFAINLDTSTSNSMAKMLRQPIVSQLERKSSDKNSKQAKQIARSSYCTLLYYALRPTATHAQLDQYWDLYVSQTLPSCFTASKNDINHACDILSALFSGNRKPVIWEENRAINGHVNPEDLPCLDSKWIRLRTARIVQVFDILFDTADWQLSKDGDAPIVLAWRSFALALGNAGGKEVKVSMDAMSAVAHIVNEIKLLLERSNSKLARDRDVLQIDIPSKADQSETFEKIRILITEAVAKVGIIPFLERRLIRTSQDSFEAADTPSSRSSRDPGSLNSPVTHLLNLLLRNVQHTSIATSYIDAIKTVLNIALQSATSRRTQLGILHNLGRLITLDGVHQKEAEIMFWRLLAEGTSMALKQPQQNEPHNDSPPHPGHEFREAVKILELGIQLRSNRNGSAWHELHAHIIDALRKDVGDEAIGLIIIEPLAGFISKDDKVCDDFVLAAAALMLEAVHWPQSPHLMARAQHRLWGVTHIAPKVISQDPFDKVYSMVGDLLSSSYASLEMLSLATVVKFISATAKMIASCPPEFIGLVLFRIQLGLAPWIEDARGILSLAPSSPFKTLYSEVNKMRTKVMNSIEHSVVFDTRFLFSIQDLVVAGFRSRHKTVVNQAIIMWNSTFGGEGTLEYPKDLRDTLQKLRSMTELRLPSFPELNGEEVTFSPLHFVDSQDEENMQFEPVVPPTRPPPLVGPLERIAESIKGVAISPISRKAAAFQGSSSPERRGVKTTPKARLRHDDSQIQFAAIESSPLQPEPLQSQYLTDRQREVKERQVREAAAMFPEIGSSTRSSSRPTDYILPKLVFKSTQNSKSARDEDTSPTYLPGALMNEFLGSSPTPSSKRLSDWHTDDPQSSPPSISSHLQIRQLDDAPIAHEDHAPVKVIVNAEEYPGNRFTNERLPSTKDYTSDDVSTNAIEDAPRPVDGQEYASNMKAPHVLVDAHPMSDFDIYVDAPSAPSVNQPSTERNENQLNDAMSSFQSEGSSHFSVEDDQVTAQLITEMEQASSQQSAMPDVTPKSEREASKKRKRTADLLNANKKIKRTLASSSPLAAAKVPRPGETVADCVMIDVREANRSRPVLPRQIKRERSESTSLFTSSQAVKETPVVEKKPVVRLRNSSASQSSSQEQDTPMTARKAIGRPRGSRNSQVKREEAEKEPASALRKSTRVSERLSGSSTSSPPMSPAASQESAKGGQWIALGKTPGRGMFRWLQRSSANSVDLGTPTASSANEGNAEGFNERPRAQDSQRQDLLPAIHHAENQITTDSKDRESVANQRAGESEPKGSGGVETEGEAVTAQGILQRFQSMLDNIKGVTFGPEEERAMVGILFESVKEVHEAGRRHKSSL
ncbi:MAG: hypothetical protein ASARMPRED_004531 [Alectoria sarmentosa]|nr:MAG: hypothetical protein ASARMPRED_004531 [Alectoria sarmentosa]